MEPPFPGMDPYLEAPSLWPDVHASLIFAIRDRIQQQLNPHYSAVITPYVTFESLEITPARIALPDVAVLTRETTPANGGVALVSAPLLLTGVMPVPTRYARLEIRSVDDDVLITAIELLSPANKRPAADGAEAYASKRAEFFKSSAHLLEIDLLRAGQRPPFIEQLPDNPYFLSLSRAERRPRIEVWPLTLRAAPPPIPVPLRRPDPDVVLDLAAALQQVYLSARYERRINYRLPPPAPALNAADLDWLDARLRGWGLRP